ncbi:MAG: hypothetical protein WC365_05280 [Candidatus Babeliales bacterium]|jgi:hypothetical protein
MNKIYKSLLIAVCILGTVRAGDTTNRTFLLPRPAGVNLPMEITTFGELTMLEKEDRFGGNFQLVPFFQQSSDHSKIAEYFLINRKSTIRLTTGTAPTDPSNATDIDINYLLHDNAWGTPGHQPAASFSLDPEQTIYGVRIDYHQNMDKILRGLYLTINLPIVHIENKKGPSVSNTTNSPTVYPNVKSTLAEYLRGDYAYAQDAGGSITNSQIKLIYAKIGDKQSDTGVADIDLALGYKFFNKEKYFGSIAIGLTIPTGNEADGVQMFTPIVGNGKHFGLGADLNLGGRIWGDIDHNFKAICRMKYRYLFENSERRTLGIKGYNWGPYLLLVQAGVAANVATSLIPAANVTTLNVDVTPGSQFDGILGITYNNGGFNLDLGYNAYIRENEHVHLKDAFEAGAYAVANRSYNTSINNHLATPSTITIGINDVTDGGLAAGTTAILSKDTLDVDAASTPSQFTNSLYAGLGYNFKDWDSPLMLGLGGKYEWASKNSVLTQWNIYGKIGVGF